MKRTALPLSPIVNYRACGACQACCTVVGVGELAKPPYTRCPHQCPSGCAIYAQRPHTCRSYHCLYSAGILQGGKAYRPDRLGVVVDLRSSGDGRQLFQAWEVWPGAFRQPRVRELLAGLAEYFPVVEHIHGTIAGLPADSEAV